MLIALLALFGVNLVVLVVLLGVVLTRRRWVTHQPGSFRGVARDVTGEAHGFHRKWRPGHGRWVHDVLVWTKGPFFFWNELLPIDGVTGERPARPGEVRRLGGEAIVATLTVGRGDHRDRRPRTGRRPRRRTVPGIRRHSRRAGGSRVPGLRDRPKALDRHAAHVSPRRPAAAPYWDDGDSRQPTGVRQPVDRGPRGRGPSPGRVYGDLLGGGGRRHSPRDPRGRPSTASRGAVPTPGGASNLGVPLR